MPVKIDGIELDGIELHDYLIQRNARTFYKESTTQSPFMPRIKVPMIDLCQPDGFMRCRPAFAVANVMEQSSNLLEFLKKLDINLMLPSSFVLDLNDDELGLYFFLYYVSVSLSRNEFTYDELQSTSGLNEEVFYSTIKKFKHWIVPHETGPYPVLITSLTDPELDELILEGKIEVAYNG